MVLTLLVYLYTTETDHATDIEQLVDDFMTFFIAGELFLEHCIKIILINIAKVMRQLLMYYLLLLQWYFNILMCWQSEYKILSCYARAVWFHITRLLAEIDEVLGDKDTVTADDLNQLKYTEQVIFILLCVNVHFMI